MKTTAMHERRCIQAMRRAWLDMGVAVDSLFELGREHDVESLLAARRLLGDEYMRLTGAIPYEDVPTKLRGGPYR